MANNRPLPTKSSPKLPLSDGDGNHMLLKNLEKKIWYFEGFQVRLVEIKGSRDVRGDQRNVGNTISSAERGTTSRSKSSLAHD